MLKKYIKYCLLFLTPVAISYCILEIAVRSINAGPKVISVYLDKHYDKIELLTLGASQNQAAVNPSLLDMPNINLASGHQDYATDYQLLKQLHPKIPNLNTVILPMTFAHFDTKPNAKNYWKNNAYLYYYGVNNFGRRTYFKDRFLFLSNTSYYTDQLEAYYIDNDIPPLNDQGYALEYGKSSFAKAEYDLTKIAQIPLSMNNTENPIYRQRNLASLIDILKFCANKNIDVIFTLTPVTQKYYDARNAIMVKRRDSILNVLKADYHVQVFGSEIAEDFNEEDFANHNHLNSRGAQKFTTKLDTAIRSN